MKKNILIFALVIVNLNLYSQDYTCDDFKVGTFIVPKDEINPNSYQIIRNNNSQMEIVSKPEGETINHQIIEWIDDCSYIMKYDGTKMSLDDTHKLINKIGGILIEKIKIEGKCYFYVGSIKGNGVDIKINGKLCLE